MAKKKTAVKSAKNRPGSRPAKDDGAPIFFYYKGARYELKIVNSVNRRFRQLAGDLLEDADALQSGDLDEEKNSALLYYVLMAVLKLQGDWKDHEDDFEPDVTLFPKVHKAMDRFQAGINQPGEPNGGAQEQSPKSATA